ncbi:MAG: sialate O-acetylesterase [Verrucomicrobiota bacterium]|nr:sialate O-acetylesterase [Verrucomicrobiota bacterium]
MDIVFAGGQSNATGEWAGGIEMALVASGKFTNLQMVHTYHPGNWMMNWYTDEPRGNFDADFYNSSQTGALEVAWQEVLDAGKQPRLAGFFWFQGEGDTGSYDEQALYVARFNQILTLLKTHFEQPALPNFAVAIIDSNQDPAYDDDLIAIGRTDEMVDGMRAKLVELGMQANGVAVDTRGATRTDLWHLTTTERDRIGSEMALAFIQTFYQESPLIDTTGTTFDMSLGTTWAGGSVPGALDTANFVNAGTYTAPVGTNFTWHGIQCSAGSTLINPAIGGNAYTIHLGAGGISGSQNLERLGANLTLDVGSNDQTWSIYPINGVQAVIIGSAKIAYSGASRLWLRGNNTFSGTWQANGSNSGIHPNASVNWASSLGADAELLNDGYIRLSNTPYDRIGAINLIGNGRMLASGSSTDDGSVATLQSPATITNSGDIFGSGDLTVSAHLNYGRLQLQGDLTHSGDTIIDNKPAGMTLDLSSASTVTFTIGTNGENNQIRGLHATNSKLSANGTFVFDRSRTDSTNGNSWTIIDVGSLAETFGATFAVDGFTAEADGATWTLVENSNSWTFSETDGILSVSDGGVPPVVSKHDVFFMGGQSNAKIDVAIGISDTLKKSGQFTDPEVVWIRHSGQAVSQWFDGVPRTFYDEDLFGQTGTYDQDGETQGLLETEINSAGGPHAFRGYFWWQGEADASATGIYATKFLGMMNQLAADLGQPIGTGTNEWSYHIALPDDVAQSYEAIRAAQIAMVDSNETVSTYLDTRPYPRLSGDTNPHPPQDLDYFIGIDMANRFLALHGLPTVDLSAAPDSTLIKTDIDVLSQHVVSLERDHIMLNRANAWSPEEIPIASTTVRFDSTLTEAKTYHLGGTSYAPPSPSGTGGAFAIKGIDYQSPHQVSLEPFWLNLDNTLSIGAFGVDASSATSRLIINVDVETPVAQTWTAAEGQSILFNNAESTIDLRNANLIGAGTIDIRHGTVDLGAQPNTALMSFYIGGPDLVFSAASDAGQPSPLGTGATLRTGSASDASFTYNGTNNASWNRNVTFDTIPAGRNGTFEVANAGTTFTCTGNFGVHDTADTLNLKLGGAGNLTVSGTGGVQNNGSAVCNLEKTGTGTLTLSGSGNTFNGGLESTSGKLLVDAASSVNSCSNITVGSASTTAIFEYASTVGLDRAVTVNPGSTFIYTSATPYTGALTVSSGAVVIVDGALDSASLSIPSDARLVLRGDASLATGISLTNDGILDISTWNGTLPSGLVNNGTLIERSNLIIDSSTFAGSNAAITIHGYPAHSYQLWTTPALQSNSWQNIGQPVEGADEPITFLDALGSHPAFYRVGVNP